MNDRLDSVSLARFLAVAEALNFREAAQALHTSQPPLSRAIKQLEDRLGVRLFERDTHRVALTAAGEALVPFARKTARLLAEAQAAIGSAAAPRRLRLGITSAVEPHWFAGLAERFHAARPDLTVSTASHASPQLVRLLRASKLDAAFIALPTESAGLDVTPIERYPLLVAMPKTHSLVKKRRLSLADLNGERVFWFERARQPAFFDHCQTVFDQHGFVPEMIREPGDHHVLLAEIASGRAMALLPQTFSALTRAGVAYRALKEGELLSVGVGLAVATDRLEFRDTLLRLVRASEHVR